MLVDAFLFYNELDLLELRLETLHRVVDRFVLVRGDRTFRGQRINRPDIDVALDALARRFALSVEVVRVPALARTAWDREHFQRCAMTDVIGRHAEPNDSDVILISDVDEIPNPDRIAEAASLARVEAVACFLQLHFYFALNLLDDEPWYGTRAISWDQLQRTSPQSLRAVGYPLPGEHTIEDGGWHFGWPGDASRIQTKVAAFSHSEFDMPDLMTESHLKKCIGERVTVHNHHRLTPVSLDLMPRSVRDNPEKYEHLLVAVDGSK